MVYRPAIYRPAATPCSGAEQRFRRPDLLLAVFLGASSMRHSRRKGALSGCRSACRELHRTCDAARRCARTLFRWAPHSQLAAKAPGALTSSRSKREALLALAPNLCGAALRPGGGRARPSDQQERYPRAAPHAGATQALGRRMPPLMFTSVLVASRHGSVPACLGTTPLRSVPLLRARGRRNGFP